MSLAAVIDFPRPEGRPSNAALQMENRTLRAAIADLTEERDELADELSAYLAERIEMAASVVALSRRGQVALANHASPARHLDALERIGLREQQRAASMRPTPEEAA